MIRCYLCVKDYHLLKFNSILNLGINENLLRLDVATFYSTITYFLGEHLRVIKPYFDLKNTLNLHEDSNELNFTCSTELVFNLLMVIMSAIKIIVEKFIYAIKSRKQQN